MDTHSPKNSDRIDGIRPLFDTSFLPEHAGKIIADPHIAIVELVANCWDAGADEVKIEWFPNNELHLAIQDNGIGMSREEFLYRWRHLNYDRIRHQGSEVEFPKGKHRGARKVYGKNGKGRHGMFCFGQEYLVETTRNGEHSVYRVTQNLDGGETPFVIHQVVRNDVGLDQHGTRISCTPLYEPFPEADLRDLIGSKFIADPAFRIFVNESEVQLTDLQHLMKQHDIEIPGHGNVKVLLFDTEAQSRTTKQHGVAWWVNNRLVGEVGWRKSNGETYIDGRSGKARRYTFIVQADLLQGQTNEDWTGFQTGDQLVKAVTEQVEEYVEDELSRLLSASTRKKVIDALELNRIEIAPLSPLSQKQVSDFADKFVEAVPTIRPDILTSAVAIVAKLEQARSGYELLGRLSKLDVSEMDQLNELLKKWSLNEAMLILDELDRRLKLIEKLESLVEDKRADELHQLQPLFEQGLWIFGPEFETASFMSNRQLATVLRDLFKDTVVESTTPKQRADFVILPDASIGVYAMDHFDAKNEPDGISKVVILELKRGGFTISAKETAQALHYSTELASSGKVLPTATITAFVLGAQLNEYARSYGRMSVGANENIRIVPKTYSDVLRAAEARTFYLRKRIEGIRRERGGVTVDWTPQSEQAILVDIDEALNANTSAET